MSKKYIFKIVKNFIALQKIIIVDFVNKIVINKYKIRIKYIEYLTQLYLIDFIKFKFIFIDKFIHQCLNNLYKIEIILIEFLNIICFVYKIEFIKKNSNNFNFFFELSAKIKNKKNKK